MPNSNRREPNDGATRALTQALNSARATLAVNEIKLVEAYGNPFELFPQLRTIWPQPYAQIAEEASGEDSHTGQVLLIMYLNVVVGITGVFDDCDYPDDIFLRWHGVIPEARRSGIARKALELLIYSACNKFYPDRKNLVELVPDNEYGRTIVEPFFQHIGFVKRGPLETWDWIDHAWQPYVLAF